MRYIGKITHKTIILEDLRRRQQHLKVKVFRYYYTVVLCITIIYFHLSLTRWTIIVQ